MTSQQPENGQVTGERLQNLPVSRRCVIKSGALASGTAAIMAAAGRTAARSSGRGEFRPAVPVTDSEDSDPDPAIVLAGLDVPIRDWTVFGTETVADHNPTYDPEDQVVVVAFEHLLDSGWPNWRRGNPDSLFDGVVDRGIKFHAFPKTRLKKARPKKGRNSR